MFKIEGPTYNAEYESFELKITDDSGTQIFRDLGEPEDNSFIRDWSWIKTELERAYEQGQTDLKSALFEVLDGIGALGGSWHELLGWGFSEERAKEIVALVEPKLK